MVWLSSCDSLADLEKQAVDLEAERERCRGVCEKIHSERLQVYRQQANKTELLITRCKKKCRLGLESASLSYEVRRKETELADKSQQVVELEVSNHAPLV